MNNIPYLLALHRVNGLGPIRLKALLEYFKDPKLVWEADIKEIKEIGIPRDVADLLVDARKKIDVQKYAQSIKDKGISWLTIFDEGYPKLLKEIYDPPVVFYYRGEILPSDRKAVAVVGTRKVTGYGKVVTEKLTSQLTDFGVTIVSGLARGVDSIAHKTAVSNQGRTLAVLGGGLNNIFPAENIKLAEEIWNGCGAVISEFPPDYPSLPGNFPARNRIISGLSLAVLVTEAAEDSGSLITARCALDQGREVFAIPGPITSELSKGPTSLIKQGAKLVTEAGEILEELGMDSSKYQVGSSKGDIKLSDIEQKILDCLSSENKLVDEICQSLHLSASEVSSALVKMEIYGLVKNLGGGNYVKIC